MGSDGVVGKLKKNTNMRSEVRLCVMGWAGMGTVVHERKSCTVLRGEGNCVAV